MVQLSESSNATDDEQQSVGDCSDNYRNDVTVSTESADEQTHASEDTITEMTVLDGIGVTQECVQSLRTARDFGLESEIEEDGDDTYEIPCFELPQEGNVKEFSLGPMNVICIHCGALHFAAEVKTKGWKGENRAVFNDCCNLGKVQLPSIKEHPTVLRNLLEGKHGMSSNFIKNIRKYNGALAFSSMVAGRPQFTAGQSAFTVHGQVYHLSCDLAPTDGNDPEFAQLYILDSDEATDFRMKAQLRDGCDHGLMRQLSDIIAAINPLAQSFKMMKRVLDEQTIHNEEHTTVVMMIDRSKKFDRHKHNIPAENEVAAIFVSNDGEIPQNRAIVVHPKTGRLRRIPIINEMVDAMTYPLLLPYGDAGWCPGVKLTNGKNLSMCQYYGYRIALREGNNTLHRGGKLWQQYIVDSYCKVEENNLNYLRYNQQKLRTEKYDVLCQSVSSDELGRTGRRVILPSSFAGSPRSQQQHFQDSMAIVSNFGKPDIFLTFTCNPGWSEIRDNLFSGQRYQDRPELIARVFKAKLDELCSDVIKNGLLGECAAYVGVIEFQKRGLPHAHILLTLSDHCKLKTKSAIDKVVTSTIPDPLKEPRLHDLVRRHMLHGPCGELNPACPCMREGKCSKRYPKDFTEETVKNSNGYPLYCRPDNGKTVAVGRHTLDNRWVVPYNKHLLLKYNCHVNVEVCSSLKSIKYLHKYVYKGPDSASIRIAASNDGVESTVDEIADYIETRYVGSPEAAWRLLKFPLHFKSHAIQRLSVHKECEKTVVYEEGNEEEALAAAEASTTTLEAFFMINQTSRDNRNGTPPDVNDLTDSRNFYYPDMPLHFVFNSKCGWKCRRNGFSKTLGRMYFVSPKDSERYYLRMLLLHCRSPYSYADLKTIEGVQYETFKEAACALGLVADDREHDKTLQEAIERYSPSQIRHLFANLLIFCNLSNPQVLWDKYKESMAEDISFRSGNLERSVASAFKIIDTIIDGRFPLTDHIRTPTEMPIRIQEEEIWL